MNRLVARRLVLSLVISVLAAGVAAAAGPSDEAWWSAAVETSLDRAGARRSAWEAALHAAPDDQRAGLGFLIEHMPTGDLASLDPQYVLENVALAYAARDAVPWGQRVPEAIFLNDVLPYANISETRDSWRAEFKARFLPVVRECATPAEAAHKLNQHIFRELGVKYSTQRKRADQSPAESIETGLASCTGLSIMLTDACRAVGVPARLAGIPNWVNKRGNHTWVEVWDGGAWHFAGAAEPDGRGLNHAWFTGDAALAQRDTAEHAIYAISYRRTGLEFPMVFDAAWEPVPAVNVTDRYATPGARSDDETRVLVTVTDARGTRVAADVAVRDTANATATFSGVSRDESYDTNDVLAFTVRRGATLEVVVRHDGRDYRLPVEATIDEEQVTFVVAGGGEPKAALDADLDADLDGDLDPGRRTTPMAMSGTVTAVVRAVPALDAWFADPGSTLPASFDDLVRDDPARARTLAWDAYRRAAHPEARADFDADRVRFDRHESPYVARRVGERPAAGWPLVIAMHGGGGAPQEVNDQQWKHMQIYYRDQPDLGGYVYLALRAPNNTWNGFYDDYVYPLVTNLVKQFLLFGDVDPDRVYLIGYSHGGYGAFAIGPKIPHRFAAIHASAAAPTDGQSVPRGLRTTPFTYMIGENDTAYGRRPRCEAFDRAAAALRGDRDDVYPVTMEFKAGYGHGGLPDRDKVRDLYPHVRHAHPRELSWEMTDTVVRDHFWVSVPEAARGRIVEATIEDGNAIRLNVTGVPRLTLRLDERLIEPGRPLVLRFGAGADAEAVTCVPVPSMRELCASIVERGDPRLSHTMRVEIDFDAMQVVTTRPGS